MRRRWVGRSARSSPSSARAHSTPQRSVAGGSARRRCSAKAWRACPSTRACSSGGASFSGARHCMIGRPNRSAARARRWRFSTSDRARRSSTIAATRSGIAMSSSSSRAAAPSVISAARCSGKPSPKRSSSSTVAAPTRAVRAEPSSGRAGTRRSPSRPGIRTRWRSRSGASARAAAMPGGASRRSAARSSRARERRGPVCSRTHSAGPRSSSRTRWRRRTGMPSD